VATETLDPRAPFDPARYTVFRFTHRRLDADGGVRLGYGFDGGPAFEERFELPEGPQDEDARRRLEPLLALLHWAAGVSYYKAAAPGRLAFDAAPPGPAAAALIAALYSEGLGEFAYRAGLPALPRPAFEVGPERERAAPMAAEPRSVLVPVGGGKDSVVALEIVRASVERCTLFTLGDAPPIARTVAVAGLPRLLATRRLDPLLIELNSRGALNGHVPVTAIVACCALLCAALAGEDAVALANERSASEGNLEWDGVRVNHQFSKSLAAERLLAAAAAEAGGPAIFSVLRPASELAIARAFARLPQYHAAITSCNAIFRLDPELRSASWCCECPKCRFVFLALAPFLAPEQLLSIFGRDLLDEPDQTDGFALLTATGGHKPFECVGEEQESVAALRLIADDPRWRSHAVVAALRSRVLEKVRPGFGDPAAVLALGAEHLVPANIEPRAREVLGA
jgi:hypothetical protein